MTSSTRMTTMQHTGLQDWKLVTVAAALAARSHEGQRRNDGTPYMQHPARVAVLLGQAGGAEALIAAGFLHDVIEDCDVDWDEVEEACNADVANWVAAMSKDMRMPEALREAAYQQQLADGPWEGRAVKLADLIDNFTNASDGALAKLASKVQWGLDISADDTSPVTVWLRERLTALLMSPTRP
jgi:(p)ppGpp synthase/HD superfamily hydrolase